MRPEELHGGTTVGWHSTKPGQGGNDARGTISLLTHLIDVVTFSIDVALKGGLAHEQGTMPVLQNVELCGQVTRCLVMSTANFKILTHDDQATLACEQIAYGCAEGRDVTAGRESSEEYGRDTPERKCCVVTSLRFKGFWTVRESMSSAGSTSKHSIYVLLLRA